MKPKWKKMFVWSSLGSLTLGMTVALARKARKVQPPPLELRPVPADCSRVSVWTEHFKLPQEGSGMLVQDRYLLQSTPFKVWSVLETEGTDPGSGPASWRIYHVTHLRFFDASPTDEASDQGQLQDRFYGTLASLVPATGLMTRDEIGRGAELAIRKCSVGGASNGVETGEIHASAAPILNFRFEYAAVEKRV